MSVLSLTSVSDFYANVPKDTLNPGAGSVFISCIVGILVVFAVLAIIYFAMLVMSRLIAGGSRLKVTSPFDCTVQSLVEGPRTNEDDVVVVVATDNGEVAEILSPASGRVTFRVKKGSKVRKGQTLFIIQ